MNRSKFLSILIFVLLLIVACTDPTATPDHFADDVTVAPDEATEVIVEPTIEPEMEERKRATFIFTQEFDTLNPYYSNIWFSRIIHQLWNEWPWTFDDENNPVPVMLVEMPTKENGGISSDGRVFTFRLRNDLVWSDGVPLTSADFQFTYQMVIDPANTVAGVSPYNLVQVLETPDEQTVVLTFAEPFAPWMGVLWHGILPAHILQPIYQDIGTLDNAEWNHKPTVGAGPFVFAEWEPGNYARFVANENYWLGRPRLDEIVIRFAPDDDAQIAALSSGEGDLGAIFSPSSVSALEEVGIGIYRVYSGYNEGYYFYLDPEKGHPALQDVNVRQAIAYAIDREVIAGDLLLGLTQPAATIWDNTLFVDPAIQPYPYNRAQANQLLDEAGWVDENGDGVREKDGIELSLTYGASIRKIRQDTQFVVQQQLAEVGIKVELLNFDSVLYFADYADGGPAAAGELDIFEYSATSEFPDPQSYNFLCSEIPSGESPTGVNWSGLCDEELDALFREQVTQVDFAERQQTFYEISRIIFNKVYWLGLWQDLDLWGISRRLRNVRISGATPFFNIIEWDIE